MSEAKILAAFYQRGSKRFCELMTNEVTLSLLAEPVRYAS